MRREVLHGLVGGRGPGLWLAPGLPESWHSGIPAGGQPLAGGRGGAWRVSLGGVRAVVRRYRRGGLLGRCLPHRFLGPGRARAELGALALLSARGLAPRPLALEERGWPVRLRLATEEVEGALDLLALARRDPSAPHDRELAAAVGRAVRAMHEAGVAHRDLHVGNVLVVPGDVRRVVLVDFDGARLHGGPVPAPRRCREVLRLCRSLDKWQATASAPAASRAAFLRAALPRGLRLGVLRSARGRHRLRRLLGRTDRPDSG